MPTPRGKFEDWFESVPSSVPPRPAVPTGPRVVVIRPVRIAQQSDPLGHYINCTSSEDDWRKKRDLSPFYLGPCKLYDGHVSATMENAWQYSKVYAEHVGTDGLPTADYLEWATEGWSRKKAERYPMGKGAKAEFHWWAGRRLSRVEARKEIYVPLYAEQVVKTRTFETLKYKWLMMQQLKGTLYFMDFDAYDTTGMTLSDVLNNSAKSMGHGYVLAMLLTEDSALKECRLRVKV